MNPKEPDPNNPVDVATRRGQRLVRLTGTSRGDRWFRSLVQNSTAIIAILEDNGTVRYISPSVEGTLGYQPEELVGKSVFDYVHPEDVEVVSRWFAEILENIPMTPPIELRLRAADGTWRHMVVRNNRFDDPDVEGVVVIARDVTERKKTQEALKESENRLQVLFENSSDVISLINLDNTIRYISPSVKRVLGYEPEELEGTLVSDLVHQEDFDRFGRKIVEEIQSGISPSRPIEARYQHRDGSWRHLETTFNVLIDDPNVQGVVCTTRDVTERKQLEEQLKHQAFHDLLTGLPNRYLLLERLEQALSRTSRQHNQVVVLFMDLDGFKVVNDSLGHEIGDRVLQAVAEQLKGCLRPEDTLARFGGDEFIVLIEDLGDPADAVRVAERLMEALREQFVVDGRELFVKPSIGIALGTYRTKSPEDLLRDADTAMYRAKAEGSSYRVFEPVMYEQALRRLKTENELQRAIEVEEFVLHYQPIVDLRSEEGEVWGVEALVRWQHPQRGLLDPEDFVPAAEESGLVVPMGEGVLREACLRAKEWQERHPHLPPLVMAVNLSARQLGRPGLARTIAGVLRETGLEARSLSLDVTETVFVKTLQGNTGVLNELKRLGVRISIDDFGTGYSSLSYLKRFPADALKIDRSFIRALGEVVEDTVIVQMILDLAHTFGMEVIAEGVESAEQLESLRSMGCDLAQGYHLARPLPPEDVPEFLAE
jgi:diguanylate cyclase (GGDEF)-like protein/PAS domain S-box-containing protein